MQTQCMVSHWSLCWQSVGWNLFFKMWHGCCLTSLLEGSHEIATNSRRVHARQTSKQLQSLAVKAQALGQSDSAKSANSTAAPSCKEHDALKNCPEANSSKLLLSVQSRTAERRGCRPQTGHPRRPSETMNSPKEDRLGDQGQIQRKQYIAVPAFLDPFNSHTRKADWGGASGKPIIYYHMTTTDVK